MRRTPAPLALALALSACSGGDAGDGSGPRGGEGGSIPPGFGWPAPAAELTRAVERGDRSLVRRHAWGLWAGISQPTAAVPARPVWWSWPTTTQLFETGVPGARLLAHRRRPDAPPASPQPCIAAICLPGPRYPVPQATRERFGIDAIRDGTHFQTNGDILVATESYSPEAAAAIRARGYADPAVFDSLRAAGVRVLPGLPERYVVTKHMYWPVKADLPTPLPVFDGLPDAWDVYGGYETWPRFVAVDASGGPEGRTVEVDFLFGVLAADSSALGPRRVSATTVSVDRFYHQRVDSTLWGELNADDRAMLDAASRWATGRPFEPGDYLVTVAMHVNTREIPSWTLQSVWWHDRPDEGPWAADRPDLPQARGPWRHYLMTTAYGIPTAEEKLPISYNPYIELAAGHPVATNCRNCHTRAAWPRARAWYLEAHGPGPLDPITPGDSLFDGALMLDLQWVFSDRVHDP